MTFQLPSAASRRIVSILNNGDESDVKGSSSPSLRPPPSSSASSASNTAAASPSSGAPPSSTTETSSSLGSSRFGGTPYGSGALSDATSVEPSPISQPSSWSSLKTSQPSGSWSSSNKTSIDEDPSRFFDAKPRSQRLTASPGPMSERSRPPGLDRGYMASDTQPIADLDQIRHQQALDGYHSMANHSVDHRQAIAYTHPMGSGPASSPTSSSSSAQKRPKPSIVHGKKRYPCTHPGCDKTFSTSGHAARHNRIHTGQKPYRCTFPGCKASFSRQDNALAHFRTGHALSKQRDADDGDVSMDGLDAQDTPLDPGAELGRMALEQGTAIAVVRDGKVERTVGLPKGRRSISSSKPPMDELSDPHQSGPRRLGPTPAAEYAQSRISGTATSVPRNKHITQTLFADTRPTSVHSDYEHRTHLPPLGAPASTVRMHPYKSSLAQHRASLGNGWEGGIDAATKYASSDTGMEGFGSHNHGEGERRLSHDVHNSGRHVPRRGSSTFAAHATHPHLLPGTLTSNARSVAHLPTVSHAPSVSSTSRGSWPGNRLDTASITAPRSRQISASSALFPSQLHTSTVAQSVSDSASARSGSPEGLLTLSGYGRPTLPCSSDRTTTTNSTSAYRYQPVSPLDGDGPIRLPPLHLPSSG